MNFGNKTGKETHEDSSQGEEASLPEAGAARKQAKLAAEKTKQAASKGADKVERAAQAAQEELKKDKE